MSKIKDLTCTICHWKDQEKKIILETNFLLWRESNATGTSDQYNISTWHWKDFTFTLQVVGVHPKNDKDK